MDYKLYSPEKNGIKSENIINFIKDLSSCCKAREIHSFMIMRNGNVLAEGYNAPYTSETEHDIFSGSKAFAAMAIGFAIDEGLIDLDDKVVDYFEDLVPEEADFRIKEITVKNLLTMTVGQTGDPVHCATKSENDDWLYNFFRREFVVDPGKEFRYDGFATYMLSALINRVSGQDMFCYLKPRLFEPMGMKVPYHIKDKYGICIGYTGMKLSISDFAGIGQLFLDGGKYKGRQILPEGWVELATSKHIDTPNTTTGKDWNQGYCFQMWRGRHNTYRFCGAFGQMCVVIPDLNMIFAVNSGCDNNKIHTILEDFYKNILFEFVKPLHEEKSYALNGFFKRLVIEPADETKCFIHLQGKENFKLPCGIGRSIASDPLFTDLVAVNPQGGERIFYSKLEGIANENFCITIKITGSPSAIFISVVDGVTKIEYKRCKV